MFQRTQACHIGLVIDENDSSCGSEQVQSTGTSFGVEFLTTAAQQVPLQQAVSEQYKDDLIDDQIEGT